MSYSKPYYRIFMPPKLKGGNYNYLCDDNKNCKERMELIRFADLLEHELKTVMEYIEPRTENFSTFSLRTYDLLVRICVEIENNFKGILFANNYAKTNVLRTNPNAKIDLNMRDDYFKTNSILRLSEYSVEIAMNNAAHPFTPFGNWNAAYQPLDWYQAYNSVKHNRTSRFNVATLENVLKGIAALRILLFAQFGPYSSCLQAHGQSGVFWTDDKGIITDYVDPSNKAIILKELPDFYAQDNIYDFDWDELESDPSSFEQVTIT